MINTLNTSLQLAMSANIPVLAWGMPGVGKTSYMNALAESLNVPIEVVITSIREPSDFGGLPIVTSNDSVFMAPPSWAKRLKEAGKGILFLDELSTAPPAVQAACLRVVYDRYVGDLKLPDEVIIVSAANPPEIAAGGWDLSSPLANRFCHLNWNIDTDAWINGMISGWSKPKTIPVGLDAKKHLSKARSLTASFINARRNLLFKYPESESDAGKSWASPRSWDMAAQLLSVCIDYNHGSYIVNDSIPDEITTLIKGCVGNGPAIEFINYIKDVDLPDPELLIADPSALNMTKYKRHDRLFAVLSSVTSAILANNTPDRWHAGFFILERVVKAGIEDVPAQAAKVLANNRPENTSIPSSIQAFIPLFKEAGLL